MTPCRLVERIHAQHWQLSTESHGVTNQNSVISTLVGNKRTVSKNTTWPYSDRYANQPVFIIYIHNIHYIILISMRLQQMVHAHGHWHPPNAKCSLHLQYPHLQGTVPNQVQGLIYLDLYITVLTWPGWFPNTCCNVAINLRECRGTTRSSWSAVSSKAAGYWNKRK